MSRSLNQLIDPKWLAARKQAEKYSRPVFESPAYIRKHLKPKIDIGCKYDSSQPFMLHPAIHTPEIKKPHFLFAWLNWARA